MTLTAVGLLQKGHALQARSEIVRWFTSSKQGRCCAGGLSSKSACSACGSPRFRSDCAHSSSHWAGAIYLIASLGATRAAEYGLEERPTQACTCAISAVQDTDVNVCTLRNFPAMTCVPQRRTHKAARVSTGGLQNMLTSLGSRGAEQYAYATQSLSVFWTGQSLLYRRFQIELRCDRERWLYVSLVKG